jgi:16S rRNA (guanine527-N7)-methyltransferase
MTSDEEVALVRAASALGVSLDAASIDRIRRFIDRLELWNRRSHLTGDRDRAVLLRKHAVDSLAVLSELPTSGAVVDVGSGAGFPGLVVGCARPDLPLVLIESRRKPASFLSDAIRSIPLPKSRVVQLRAEEAARDPSLAGGAGVVLSRAIRLDRFLPLAASLTASGGRVIAMQTPATLPDTARQAGDPHGLELSSLKDYRLPDGEHRRLLIFSRR